MGTVIERKQTSFRLSVDLINRLRLAAEKENRSLNNFVESVLMDVVSDSPNAVTLSAMEEARNASGGETFDSVESLMKELME